jgi:ABC-type glycerol-3-phosphate transport system permease component
MAVTAHEPVAPRRRRRLRPGLAAVWLLVAFNVLVVVWLLLASLREHSAIFSDPWGLDTLGAVANYATAWSGSNFGRATVNTVLLVGAASVVIVALSAPAAYVLSRSRMRIAAPMSVFFAIGIGIPFQVIVIPLFVLVSELNLVNSLLGLFVLYVALSLPFTVFLLTGFSASIPSEMEEAAALDGASPWKTFTKVMLPLSRPGLITALILNAIGLWNETFIALVFIQDTDKETLSLALLGFLTKQQYAGADYGGLFAGVAILVIPMIALYVWLGRRIIEGLTLGAGK